MKTWLSTMDLGPKKRISEITKINVIGEKAFLKVPWIAITPCVLYRHAMALSFVSAQALSNGGVQLFPPVHVRGNEPAYVPGSTRLSEPPNEGQTVAHIF